MAIAPGQTATFSVATTGGTPTYQWFKDGISTPLVVGGKILSADNLLQIQNVDDTDAGRYSAKVGSSSCGTFKLESAPARLHVKGNPPEITLQPRDENVPLGGGVALTAQASAVTPISYQWRLNNEPIGAVQECAAGTCEVSYSVANAQCAKDAGLYSVTFWNKYGYVTTRNCKLRINGKQPVTVTANPNPPEVTQPDQIVTLTADTCLKDVKCIQWYITAAGSPKIAIPGANQLSYTIPVPITCDELGIYTVSIGVGGWNYYEASIEVSSILTPEVSFANATFKITPDNIGTGEWGYDWYFFNGVQYEKIPDEESDSYTPPLTVERSYLVIATRTSGEEASVEVHYHPWPYVSAQASQNGSLSVTLAMNVSGGLGPNRWYFTPEGSTQAQDTGVTTPQITINPVDCTKRGTYEFVAQAGCVPSAFKKMDLFDQRGCQ